MNVLNTLTPGSYFSNRSSCSKIWVHKFKREMRLSFPFPVAEGVSSPRAKNANVKRLFKSFFYWVLLYYGSVTTWVCVHTCWAFAAFIVQLFVTFTQGLHVRIAAPFPKRKTSKNIASTCAVLLSALSGKGETVSINITLLMISSLYLCIYRCFITILHKRCFFFFIPLKFHLVFRHAAAHLIPIHRPHTQKIDL